MDSSKKILALSIFAFLLFFACGPKPQPAIEPAKSPEHLWQIFASKYDSIESLALKGSFQIKGEKSFETSLQVVYAAPDSFAFLAEATLGIDAARGSLVRGKGFWEIPRENYSEQITIFDQIKFENYTIDIDILLQALFFFKALDYYEFEEIDSYRYKYIRIIGDQFSELALNKDSATPINLTIRSLSPVNPGYFEIRYFDWQKTGIQMIYPGRIEMYSESDSLTIHYSISRIKENPRLPVSLFKPRF